MGSLRRLIKQRRVALGLSTNQLATAVGVSSSEVNHLENGDDIGETPVTVLVALANALDVPAWHLVELIESDTGSRP